MCSPAKKLVCGGLARLAQTYFEQPQSAGFFCSLISGISQHAEIEVRLGYFETMRLPASIPWMPSCDVSWHELLYKIDYNIIW